MAIRKLAGFWSTFQYGLQVLAEHSSGVGVLISVCETEKGLVLRIVVQRYGARVGAKRNAEVLSTTEIDL